jgi:class 3 adenylate cyclase
MTEPISITNDSFRVDFKLKPVGKLPDGSLQVELTPDPDRYEWKDDDEHGRVLYDRNTSARILESVIVEMAEQSVDVPIYGPASLPSAESLFAARRKVIGAALGTDGHPEALANPSADLLAEKLGESQDVAVLSADVVDSTRLSADKGGAYRRVNEILLREIAAVTSAFGGVIINYAGDGGLAGFLGPGFNLANDLAFDAATALVADIYGVMNPLLEEAGLFGVDVRVGLDMNEAEVTAVGSEDNRRQLDVLGIGVSMAAKVQGRATPGEVWVGQTLYETLHVSRQRLLEPAPPGEGWDFVNRAGQPYALYRLQVVPPSSPEDG